MTTGRESSGEKSARAARTAALLQRPPDAPQPETADIAVDCTANWDAAQAFYEQGQVAYTAGDYKAGDFYVSVGDGFRRLALLCSTVDARDPTLAGVTPAGDVDDSPLALTDLLGRLNKLQELATERGRPARPGGLPTELEHDDRCLQYARAASHYASRAAQAFAAGDVLSGNRYLHEAQAHWALFNLCVSSTQATARG
ncbi:MULTISPECIES: hypothetical protein [unclassified Streptomyces]|uniref:hypothetical protein n=1 Tax=unclassified Streptomyces TaxID=2593676 RepID=UPI002966AAD8|nr:hypothetical protein [Streptomyces sp. SJL17-1]